MNRRNFLAIIAALSVSGTAKAGGTEIHVKKSANCACCSLWVRHVRQAGFVVTTEDLALGQLMRFKLDHGITPKLASCHTARVEGYTIEGHVPAKEIVRLLSERPSAIGLAVPDMPIGSPGMESGNIREEYDVLLIMKDGSTKVYASYAKQG